MRISILMTVLALGLPGMAFADATKCDCTKKCMKNCTMGKGHKCKCKSCDCKTSKQCDKDGCNKDMGSAAPAPDHT